MYAKFVFVLLQRTGTLLMLRDTCIVFEHFTASIGYLMVANWIYWWRVRGASIWIFASTKSTTDAVKFSNTLICSHLHSNASMCIALPHYWQGEVSGNRQYFMIFQPCNWYRENYSIVQSQTRNIKQLRYNLYSHASWMRSKSKLRLLHKRSSKVNV